MLGGSSSINGLVYVRGNPFDFDRWEEEGAHGWGYRNVLPYFRRAEKRAGGGDRYHGDSGKLSTTRGSMSNPLNSVWIEAGRQAGYPVTSDMNGFQQEGFGGMDMTVGRGRRCSAANAYLRPAMSRGNLSVRTHALVTRVLFEERRAVGVSYTRGGVAVTVRARREVIVSAGSIASPQLLKLSGVGPAAELQALGIPVVHDLPGVGENLQDHLEFYFQVASREPVTLYKHMNPLGKALIGMRWILSKDGLGATNHFEAGGFIRSRPGIEYPDIQYHFLPMAVTYDGTSLAQEHGFQAHVGPMRSKSKGWVRLESADPDGQAADIFQLSVPRRRSGGDAGLRAADAGDLFPAGIRPLSRARDPARADVQTDEQIDEFMRQKVESAYHPSCSCRMGA